MAALSEACWRPVTLTNPLEATLVFSVTTEGRRDDPPDLVTANIYPPISTFQYLPTNRPRMVCIYIHYTPVHPPSYKLPLTTFGPLSTFSRPPQVPSLSRPVARWAASQRPPPPPPNNPPPSLRTAQVTPRGAV